MINWIEKWIIDRKQRVVVDVEVSNWISVLSGVPHESVLGPILFLIQYQGFYSFIKIRNSSRFCRK